MNKTVTILELSANSTKDEILRQVNEYLVRNKNGDPIQIKGSKDKKYSGSPDKFSPSKHGNFDPQPRMQSFNVKAPNFNISGNV
jgi:hypothetical protein